MIVQVDKSGKVSLNAKHSRESCRCQTLKQRFTLVDGDVARLHQARLVGRARLGATDVPLTEVHEIDAALIVVHAALVTVAPEAAGAHRTASDVIIAPADAAAAQARLARDGIDVDLTQRARVAVATHAYVPIQFVKHALCLVQARARLTSVPFTVVLEVMATGLSSNAVSITIATVGGDGVNIGAARGCGVIQPGHTAAAEVRAQHGRDVDLTVATREAILAEAPVISQLILDARAAVLAWPMVAGLPLAELLEIDAALTVLQTAFVTVAPVVVFANVTSDDAVVSPAHTAAAATFARHRPGINLAMAASEGVSAPARVAVDVIKQAHSVVLAWRLITQRRL